MYDASACNYDTGVTIPDGTCEFLHSLLILQNGTTLMLMESVMQTKVVGCTNPYSI